MYDARQRAALADELADAFLTSAWSVTALAESGAGWLDRWPGWMEALAIRVASAFRASPAESRHNLVAVIESFLAEHAAWPGETEPPGILRLLVSESAPSDRPRLDHDWPIAEIDSVAALADRLELSLGQLAWLADVRSLERRVDQEKLRNGFRRGRSVATHAGLHVGQAAVLRLDLKDFFASVSAGRVFGIYRTVGYSRSVAHVLTGLSTNTIPQEVWQRVPRTRDPGLIEARFWLGRGLATPHLPQGAPTSPALANLAAFRLDRRLAGLAATMALRYSRYADDLTFSGSADLLRRRPHFEALVTEIAREEGFAVNPGKSALHTAAACQRVCGVVVNVRPNVVRSEYDQLKAILHNAAHDGPESQNRDGVTDFASHLRGRISWVASLNPARGQKLRRRFEEISWDDA